MSKLPDTLVSIQNSITRMLVDKYFGHLGQEDRKHANDLIVDAYRRGWDDKDYQGAGVAGVHVEN